MGGRKAIIIEIRGDEVEVHITETIDFLKNLHFLGKLDTRMEVTMAGAQNLRLEDILKTVREFLIRA